MFSFSVIHPWLFQFLPLAYIANFPAIYSVGALTHVFINPCIEPDRPRGFRGWQKGNTKKYIKILTFAGESSLRPHSSSSFIPRDVFHRRTPTPAAPLSEIQSRDRSVGARILEKKIFFSLRKHVLKYKRCFSSQFRSFRIGFFGATAWTSTDHRSIPVLIDAAGCRKLPSSKKSAEKQRPTGRSVGPVSAE